MSANMTRTLALMLVILLLSAKAQCEIAAPSHPELRKELLAMAEEDQKARQVLVGMSHAEMAVNQDVMQRVVEVDRINVERLKAIIETHGWPKISMAGHDGAHAAWLLAQHADADREFQAKVLALMEALLPSREVNAAHVAYLHDRITRPQRYGTQGECVSPGKWEPFELEAPDEVDRLREQAGIRPPKLSEYVAFMNQLCK